MMGTMDKLLIQASMGPRFCKRGNTHADIISRRAVFVLQWGHAFVSVETPALRGAHGSRLAASMGPRFCKRGNDLLCRLSFGGDALQWGHAFVSVETGAALAGMGGAAGASMGPRFCKRGNGIRDAGPGADVQASMGPRFCKRGNAVGWSGGVPGRSFNGATLL